MIDSPDLIPLLIAGAAPLSLSNNGAKQSYSDAPRICGEGIPFAEQSRLCSSKAQLRKRRLGNRWRKHAPATPSWGTDSSGSGPAVTMMRWRYTVNDRYGVADAMTPEE